MGAVNCIQLAKRILAIKDLFDESTRKIFPCAVTRA